MDYYEELGVDPAATEEEIRRAHRRLTKLVHPDAQTDEAMKQLAETQMRRLNSIVEILYDPDKRREYDEQLRRGLNAFQPVPARRGFLRSWPWWVASTLGAVVLTVGAVWFWADNWGSSFGNRTPTYISPQGQDMASDATRAATPPERAATQPPATIPPNTGFSSRTVAAVPSPAPTVQTGKTTEDAAGEPPLVAELPPPKKTLNLPPVEVSAHPRQVRIDPPPPPGVSLSNSHVETASLPSGILPGAPKLAEPAAPPPPAAPVAAPATPTKTVSYTSTPAKPTDPLAGEWVYAPTAPEKKKIGFYPPEFIDLKLFRNDAGAGLRGEYHARYQVSDKPISPDVSFTLSPAGSGDRSFVWTSGNGSRGTLKISAVDASSIRINWQTTVFSPTPALTAGTAVLVRRTP